MLQRGLDVAVVAAVLALVALVALLAGQALAATLPMAAYNAIFGLGALVLTVWLYARLWWLMRESSGPAVLVAWAGAAALFGVIYSSVWSVLLFRLPVVGVLDEIAFAVRVAGLVVLAVGLWRWDRLPVWVGGVFGVYALAMLVRALVGFAQVQLPSVAFSALWVACLAALAVGLLVPAPAGRAQASVT